MHWIWFLHSYKNYHCLKDFIVTINYSKKSNQLNSFNILLLHIFIKNIRPNGSQIKINVSNKQSIIDSLFLIQHEYHIGVLQFAVQSLDIGLRQFRHKMRNIWETLRLLILYWWDIVTGFYVEFYFQLIYLFYRDVIDLIFVF